MTNEDSKNSKFQDVNETAWRAVDHLAIKENIRSFQKNLNHQINSFKKRIIVPGDIQVFERKIIEFTQKEIKARDEKHLITRSKKNIYDECSNLFLPLSTSKLFRFIHLRNFAQILDSLNQALIREHPIEICFHLRNYLEYCASFSYAIDKIIPVSKDFLNNVKVQLYPNIFGVNRYYCPEEYLISTKSLYRLFYNLSFNTNVSVAHGLEDPLDGNESIVPEKSYSLKPDNITKKLKAFEKKVDSVHPTYDLLSEFLHPNSFPLLSSIRKKGSQASNIDVVDLSLEGALPNVEYFFSKENRLFFEEITLEALKCDSKLISLQGVISKKIKVAVRKRLSAHDYKSDSHYASKSCVCSTKKSLIACCAK